jgi:hypothetical protein
MRKFSEKFTYNRLMTPRAASVVLIMILMSSFCFAQCRALSSSSTQQVDYLYWEEEIPNVASQDSKEEETQVKRRRLFWQGRMDDKSLTGATDADGSSATTSRPEPHSMRTNEWQVKLSMSRKERHRLGIHNKTIFLDFSETGHVRVMNTNTSATLAIGTWKLLPSGIMWKFPIQQTDSSAITTIQCHADLILNPFGSRPRMVRGTMVKNCRKWFRPVVATFSAEGVGQDTADVSYRDRGFGL